MMEGFGGTVYDVVGGRYFVNLVDAFCAPTLGGRALAASAGDTVRSGPLPDRDLPARTARTLVSVPRREGGVRLG